MKFSLRDQLWPVIIGIITLLFMAYIFYVQRQNKELSYEILSATSLISKNKEIEGKLKILYQNKEVDNIYLIIIKLTNSGNVSLNRSDYESPIIFSFNQNISIMEADIIRTEPDNIKSEINIDKNRLIIKPLLLNESDSITFKIILPSFEGYINADARIFGIKDISLKRKV